VKSLRPTHPYIRVKGRWAYLYRAVDSRGQTIDFLLSAKRDAEAAKRFFRKALAQPHTVNPRTITVDKNPAYPKAVAEMKENAELWRFARLRQVRFLNNIVEQDHRRVKRLTRPGLARISHTLLGCLCADAVWRPDCGGCVVLPDRGCIRDGTPLTAVERCW
jgi:transposase, IS6 family